MVYGDFNGREDLIKNLLEVDKFYKEEAHLKLRERYPHIALQLDIRKTPEEKRVYLQSLLWNDANFNRAGFETWAFNYLSNLYDGVK